jgi:hypothetical protein
MSTLSPKELNDKIADVETALQDEAADDFSTIIDEFRSQITELSIENECLKIKSDNVEKALIAVKNDPENPWLGDATWLAVCQALDPNYSQWLKVKLLSSEHSKKTQEKNDFLIGGPCKHGVSNNGFECPECHPPLNIEKVRIALAREFADYQAMMTCGIKVSTGPGDGWPVGDKFLAQIPPLAYPNTDDDHTAKGELPEVTDGNNVVDEKTAQNGATSP